MFVCVHEMLAARFFVVFVLFAHGLIDGGETRAGVGGEQAIHLEEVSQSLHEVMGDTQVT